MRPSSTLRWRRPICERSTPTCARAASRASCPRSSHRSRQRVCSAWATARAARSRTSRPRARRAWGMTTPSTVSFCSPASQ
eukprot:2805803-Prymnesium_polylepis.1